MFVPNNAFRRKIKITVNNYTLLVKSLLLCFFNDFQFYYMLMIIFLGEVALAIVSFVFYGQIRAKAEAELPEELISRYRVTDDDFQSLIDGIQVQVTGTFKH